MPIVRQKKVTLYALKEKREDILVALQRYGKMHVEVEGDINPEEFISGTDETSKQLEMVEWAILQLKHYDERKKPMLAPKPEITFEDVNKTYVKRESLIKTAQDLRSLEDEKIELNSRRIRLDNQIESMYAWENLDIEVQNITNTENCSIAVGTISVLESQDFFNEIDLMDNVDYQKIYIDRDSVYILLIYHIEKCDEMVPLLSRSGFSQYSFAGLNGKPKDIIKNLKNQAHEINNKANTIDDEIKKHANSLPDMEVLLDALMIEDSKNKRLDNFVSTEYVFMLQGYIPAHLEEELTNVIKKHGGDNIDLEISKPDNEDTIPTLYENRAFTKPFESITDMFATSKYNALDPNITMAPFFALFFGMMMSDAGYGLILALIASFIYVKTKPKNGEGNKLLRVIAISGVFTILWGILYGGFMGFAIKPLLFNPMEEPMLTLGLCLGMGVLHILVGMSVRAASLIKRKQIMEAISEQFTWIALLLGLVMFAMPTLSSFVNAEPSAGMLLVSEIGKYMLLVGLAGIILLGGYGKKGFGRIFGGVSSLMDITGYLSDILSYARLFGLGLATGVIGMVINEMVGMMTGSVLGWIVAGGVFIFAHLFNIAINALGAYVHSSRLQYVEYFGKFFEDGGKAYKPFKMKTKYHNVVDETQNK